jgi:3-oxoacyl-[acyl-carrier-protein] synthase II
MKREVVITGLGLVSPMENGRGIDIFWDGLCNGNNTIKPIKSFNVDNHKCHVGGEVDNIQHLLDDADFNECDKCTQFFALASQQALKDSGINYQKEFIGVSFGTILGGIISGERYISSILRQSPKDRDLLRKYTLHSIPSDIANKWSFRGPNICINTACSAGADAIGIAYREIQSGRIDVMLAGGADSLSEFVFCGFSALGALTQTDKVQPFDKNRSGLALSEGAGAIILEEKEHAISRNAKIYCYLSGFGSANDAYNIVRPHINGEGLSRAMDMAAIESGDKNREINYISAHGTGTVYNDLMETKAIKLSFGKRAKKIRISSIKSMLGHGLGASSVIEAICCIKTMQSGIIPPTINYQVQDPECDLDYVPNHAVRENINASMSLSAGFGGQNTALIFIKDVVV